MKRPLLALLAAGILLATTVTVVGADLSPYEVRKAMDQGVKFLKGSQNANGSWPEDARVPPNGVTALCTLALLNAGVDSNEAHVAKALEYLRKLLPEKTYVVALQTMVLCREAKPGQDQDVIARNVQWLEETQIKKGPPEFKGGWSYPLLAGQPADNADPSNSQFALLALYEAARAAESGQIHVTIPRDVWERAQKYWSFNQADNGAWGYKEKSNGTGSMTCAGISSLVIAGDVLHEPDARVTGDQIDGCYRPRTDDQDHVDRAVTWLWHNFSVTANPPAWPMWHYYYLYGLERVGRLTARRKLGPWDWYREGANYLIQAKAKDVLRDSWKGSSYAEDNENIATSLALLFLSKGRWPVLMAKVQYHSQPPPREKDGNWNPHRHDVNNLTMYVESKWGMELTWQTIDVGKASVDDLLQVPVLFFSGGGNPLPENEDDQKKLAANLRDYIDRGGFIFADGEGCSSDFDQGFRQLVKLAFDRPEYGFKPLDASHPIWMAEQRIPLHQERLLLGIDYGCRTSVVYAPCHPPGLPKPSLACLWELSRGGERESYSPAVQEQIQGGLAIGINVLAYATNRVLLPKEYISEKVVPTELKDPVSRGKFAVAKLRHPGGCDAAPRALANLMEQAGHELHIRVETSPKLIGMQDPALFDYAVVFMHGRNAFRLTDGERQALREYVRRGGLLFADAICGSEAFAESFRNEMAIIFPKNALENISPRDPIWTTQYGGADLSTVKRRDPQPGQPGEPLKFVIRDVPLEMKGVRFGDHYGVIFSEFDLSCALEKHESMGCRGYTREDAARIGLNVLCYGIQK